MKSQRASRPPELVNNNPIKGEAINHGIPFFIMSTSINDMKRRFATANIRQVAEDSIYESRDEIKELQIDQLKHGLKKDGTPIGKYRNAAYAARKNQQNPLAGFGNVDLILTGDLKNQIFVDVREDSFVIDSADEKTGGLIKKYGDPFGLTEDSNASLIKAPLRPTFVRKMKEKLKL